MKKIILTTVCSAMLFATQPLSAGSALEDELKESSAGTVSSRFRFGYSAGIGYQGRIGGDGDTKIQGLLLEGGLYGLINPARNLFDIEVGINGKYNTGMSSSSSSSSNSGKKTYYAGLKQVAIYGGTVFRFGEKGKAISLGVSKALYIDEVQSEELKADGYKKHDLENGIGAYIEYQTDETSGGIFFVRAEVQKMDIVSEIETQEETIGSILFGMKF